VDLAAGRVSGVALLENAREFLDRESDGESAADEVHALERLSGIDAVPEEVRCGSGSTPVRS